MSRTPVRTVNRPLDWHLNSVLALSGRPEREVTCATDHRFDPRPDLKVQRQHLFLIVLLQSSFFALYADRQKAARTRVGSASEGVNQTHQQYHLEPPDSVRRFRLPQPARDQFVLSIRDAQVVKEDQAVKSVCESTCLCQLRLLTHSACLDSDHVLVLCAMILSIRN